MATGRNTIMLSNLRIHSIIKFLFYMILIGISIQSWINLMDEHSTFEETINVDEAKLPSFTLCPYTRSDNLKLIESFEDVTKEIEDVKMMYNIRYLEYKTYEEIKSGHETYNNSLNNVWYFAPKIMDFPPFETVVCLIWTPDRKQEIKKDWGFKVSSSKVSQSIIF